MNVGLHHDWDQSKVEQIMRDAGVDVVVTCTRFVDRFIAAAQNGVPLKAVVLTDACSKRHTAALHSLTAMLYADLIAEGTIHGETYTGAGFGAPMGAYSITAGMIGDESHIFTLMYSSGTTGAPKGIGERGLVPLLPPCVVLTLCVFPRRRQVPRRAYGGLPTPHQVHSANANTKWLSPTCL